MDRNNDHIQEEGDSASLKPNKKLPTVGLVLGVLALLVISSTKQPGSGGPAIVLFFLASLFLIFLSLFSLVIQSVLKLAGFPSFSSIRLFYTSISISLGCIFLVGLQTLQQLQLIDVILMVTFEMLLNFYLLRRF